MSHSHDQKRKAIRKFKREFGNVKWYPYFRNYVVEIIKERERALGSPISLEELMKSKIKETE